MKRYGVGEAKGTGGQVMPFARAVEADGWLYVSGQTPTAICCAWWKFSRRGRGMDSRGSAMPSPGHASSS